MTVINTVVEIEPLLASFSFSSKYMTTMVRFAVLEATAHGRTVAYNNAPVDTGYYRSTFDTQFESSSMFFMGEFGTDHELGYALELGSHSGTGLGWHPGKPHFSIAANEAEVTFYSLIEDAVNHD